LLLPRLTGPPRSGLPPGVSGPEDRPGSPGRHPPLARDGYGNPQAIPEGTAGWCLKRETCGRPKTIVGADRQPARFPLDVTADDVEAMVGGTYRVYAIGAEGGARLRDHGQRRRVGAGRARAATWIREHLPALRAEVAS
jgi:hypothetical protein